MKQFILISVIFFCFVLTPTISLGALIPIQNYTMPTTSHVYGGMYYDVALDYLYITTNQGGSGDRARIYVMNFTNTSTYTYDSYVYSNIGDSDFMLGFRGALTRPYNDSSDSEIFYQQITETCNADCIKAYNMTSLSYSKWSDFGGTTKYYDIYNTSYGIGYFTSSPIENTIRAFSTTNRSLHDYGTPCSLNGWSESCTNPQLQDFKMCDWTNNRALLITNYQVQDDYKAEIVYVDLDTLSVIDSYTVENFGITNSYTKIAPINCSHVFLGDENNLLLVDLTDDSNASTISAISPISNNSVDNSGTTLRVRLDPADSTLNGSLTYYLSGTLIENKTITASAQTDYYSATGELTGESATWYAVYTDTVGNTFSTGTQDFVIEQGLADDLGDSVADAFGLKDDDSSTKEEKGIAFFALILSLVFSFVPVFIIFRHGDSNNVGMVFVVMFLTCLIIFTFMGWLPSWIILILLIITGFLIASFFMKRMN